MRIAVVAPPWVPVPPVGYGGTEAIIDCLARGFKKAGHEVVLATVPESTCPVPKVSILPKADTDRLNWSVVEMRHIIGAYEQFQDFDVVHDHTLMGPIYSERFADLRVVTTQHHPFDEDFREIFAASAGRVSMVGISRHQASRAAGLNIEKVIHHGLEPSDFTFNDDPEDYFLFLGRMSPNKGAHRAAAIAREAGVKLKIAARLSDAEGEPAYFNEYVKPLLGNGVEFIGEVGYADKAKLIANAKALLNPIRWPEPFGLVMIESLACGTPVLAFPEGAAPEIIEEGRTGFICLNESDMVEKVKMIDSIDRRACRRSMEEYFCADRMVREYLEYFEQVIDRNEGVQPGFAAPSKAKVFDLAAVEATAQTGSIESELTSFLGRDGSRAAK